jgi:hypothetical protein
MNQGVESPAPTRTRYGTTHPEQVENELWEQAIREGWSGYHLCEHLGGELDASRFQHRFSHSSYRDTNPRPFWSWERFGRTSTPLPDGRIIHIAGEHEDHYDADFCIYNDVVVEYPGGRREFYLYPKDVFPPTDFHTADPWIYNDVVVTHPDGAVDILIYPKEVFPHLGSKVGVLLKGDVYVFGIIDRERHPERSRGPAVLRLDTSSYEIAVLPVAAPPVRVNIYRDSDWRDGNRVVFPIVRDRGSDPELGIAFDLETLSWSEPFPHAHPRFVDD